MLRLLHEKLDALQRAYLFALCLPAALLLAVLKIVRIFGTDNSVGVLSSIDAFKSEFLLALGLSVGGVWLLDMVRKRWPRRLVMASLQIVWLAVLIIEVSGHQFFMATGSSLDYYLLAFSLENFSENAEVITSEAPRWVFALGPLALGWVLIVPWVLRWRLAGRSHESISGERRMAAVTAVFSVAFLGAAVLPPFFPGTSSLGRATTVNVAVSASSALQDSFQDPIEADSGALKTRLEPATSASAVRRRNLAIILLESTRARSTSIYNPELESTPFLAELAKKSTVAKRAHAVVPHTSKALVATLCGIEPRLHMPITEAAPGNIPANCLAKLLRNIGYETAYFQSALQYFEGRAQLVENMGYETFVPVDDMDATGFDKVNYFGREDNIMLEPSRDWLEAHKHRPFFTTYLTLTPHHNYTNPRRYGDRDFVEDKELNDYINTIYYVDKFAKNLIDQYKEMGLYEDTVFVFVGDHGEGFGEHGRRQHDNVIYQEGLHIPMVIHDPQAPEQRIIDLPVNQLDLLPTLVSMLGYKIADGEYPGTDMHKLDEVRPIRAHCWYERRCLAEIVGDEKFIHHFDSRPDEFFNLAEDPLEKTNLAAKRDDLDERRRRLLAWRSQVNAVYRTHAERTLGEYLFDEVPDIEHRVEATFGGDIELLGYDLSDDSVKPGESFTVTYYFRAEEEVAKGWNLFVHGEGTGPFKNLDHVPVSGLYPLQDWQPGQIVADKHEVKVSKKWKPGHYDIYLGFWHEKHGRKKIEGDVEVDDDRAKVVSVEIVP